MKLIKDLSAILASLSFFFAVLVIIYLLATGWNPKSVTFNGGPVNIQLEPPAALPTALLPAASAPVIEAIDFPEIITCDDRKYYATIHFRDLDQNTYLASYELIYSKKQTSFSAQPIVISTNGQDQSQGATFSDYVQWRTLGDEVIIRVKLADGTGLTASKDFEFKCSN